MTRVVFTVGGTWNVTVTAVDTGMFTTFNKYRYKLNNIIKQKMVSPYLRNELNVVRVLPGLCQLIKSEKINGGFVHLKCSMNCTKNVLYQKQKNHRY